MQGKTSDSYESGFRLGNPVAGSGQTSTQNQILQNKPGTAEVDMTIFANTFALMHSHYDGLYPIFSPGDILLFNKWIIWAIGYNSSSATPKIPLNDLTLSVVTSNGNYLLNFSGTEVNKFPEYTQKQFDDLNEKYSEDYLKKATTIGNVSGNITYDMDKLELEFLKFLKNRMNMTGLKLYKVGSNGKNTEIYLENGNRKTKECL